MNRGGLCEVCVSPGHCCKDLFLSSGSGRIEAPMSFEAAEHAAMMGVWMFRPLRQMPNGSWRWSCTQLQSDGRCGIYEDRPQLCRDYAAGSDPLCVHYVSPVDPDA